MAINKKAKCVRVKLNGAYALNATYLVKKAEHINMESTKQNLVLSSNKKVALCGSTKE